MKNALLAILICAMVAACGTSKTNEEDKTLSDKNLTGYENSEINGDTVKIENDSLDYKIIIFEPGFRSYLATQRPRGYYGQNYLEQRNWRYVVRYNGRVSNPNLNRSLYTMRIDYEPTVDYGYEVNYLLYNYFQFFMQKYNQRL